MHVPFVSCTVQKDKEPLVTISLICLFLSDIQSSCCNAKRCRMPTQYFLIGIDTDLNLNSARSPHSFHFRLRNHLGPTHDGAQCTSSKWRGSMEGATQEFDFPSSSRRFAINPEYSPCPYSQLLCGRANILWV